MHRAVGGHDVRGCRHLVDRAWHGAPVGLVGFDDFDDALLGRVLHDGPGPRHRDLLAGV